MSYQSFLRKGSMLRPSHARPTAPGSAHMRGDPEAAHSPDAPATKAYDHGRPPRPHVGTTTANAAPYERRRASPCSRRPNAKTQTRLRPSASVTLREAFPAMHAPRIALVQGLRPSWRHRCLRTR